MCRSITVPECQQIPEQKCQPKTENICQQVPTQVCTTEKASYMSVRQSIILTIYNQQSVSTLKKIFCGNRSSPRGGSPRRTSCGWHGSACRGRRSAAPPSAAACPGAAPTTTAKDNQRFKVWRTYLPPKLQGDPSGWQKPHVD